MTTTAVATTLALLASGLSPFLLRYVKLDGLSMSAISYLAAVVIAVAASLVTGDLRFDRTSLLTVLGGSAAFWTVQQAVYVVLKQTIPGMVQLPVPSPTPTTTPTSGAKPA